MGAQRCDLCVVGVTNELTMSQAHVLSVTRTQLNNGVHLLFASLWILMPLVDSQACRPTKSSKPSESIKCLGKLGKELQSERQRRRMEQQQGTEQADSTQGEGK